MAEFLLEILSEEIPARMQKNAEEQLQRLLTDNLQKEGLSFTKLETCSTPRRLTAVVAGLPLMQADTSEEKKGPRIDAAPAAIEGFLRGAGLTSLDQCEKRDTGKGEFWFAVIKRKGRKVAEILPDIIEKIIAEFSWPKSMRWGSGDQRWVRPLQQVMAILDGKPLKDFSVTTAGHRFLSQKPVKPKNFADYEKQLEKNYVIVSRAERADRIAQEVYRLAESKGLRASLEEYLLEEITGLVEWPVVLMGGFEPEYLKVPKEVLMTTMKVNQKYVPLLNKDGTLAPYFIVVSNMIAKDGGKAIVAGNERVLRARLSDAKFFFEQDLKIKLENRVDALRQITFHEKLGTMHEKVQRVRKLAEKIASLLNVDVKLAGRAAQLCKADLVSGMVGEFPELQGIMGGYYALHDGEAPEVAEAVRDHYLPLGPATLVPMQPVSVVIALADKLDSLTEFFRIGEKPTGSKDPYALRRAALGIIRIILENQLRIELQDFFDVETATFMLDRLKVALKDQGLRHDVIDSVAGAICESDLVRMVARIRAVQSFIETETGKALLAGYKRGANILSIEEKKDKASYDGTVDNALLDSAAESALAGAIRDSLPAIELSLKNEDFAGAMEKMAALRPAVDAFFDKVMVNDSNPDLRRNRLQLLAFLRNTMNRVADFSKIEG